MTSDAVIQTCMLGGPEQGKSALVLQFITETFLTDYDPTIEDTYRKDVTVNDRSVLLEILDTAGEEIHWNMQEHWIKDSQIFLLVFSICSHDGFRVLDELRATVCKYKGDSDAPIILVGTHLDLAGERVITKDVAQQKATAWNVEYIEVSAQSGEGLTKLFASVVELYYRDPQRRAVSDEEVARKNGGGMGGGGGGGGGACFSCVCGRGDDDDDFDELDLDGDAFRAVEKKMQKIQFFKLAATEPLPADIIPTPILSLKNFRIAHDFHWLRFVQAALSGLLVPIAVTLQTMAFLTYSDRAEPWLHPADYPWDDIHYALLWDFLGMVVGRKPGQDPETKKDRKWFLRQTGAQKAKRVVFTLVICSVFVFCCFNLSQLANQGVNVSFLETVGPFLLFWVVWALLSVWIGFELKLKPSIPAPTRLRSLPLFFGEDFSHRSSAYKFVRAFESSRTTNRWKLSKTRTFVIVFLGALYACIPGLTRLTFGDTTESDGESGRFFNRDLGVSNSLVQIFALVSNFVMVTSMLYCVDIQYKKQFDNYREWINDLTLILTKSDAENDPLKAHKNDDVVDVPTRGSAFSKDLFLSLTRRQNALGWLEVRSFVAAQGQILFAEQELPTLWMMVITCVLTCFCLYRAYFLSGNPLQSILWNGAAVLTIICWLALVRILLMAWQIGAVQSLQEKLVAEQKYFLRCDGVHNRVKIDSFAMAMEKTRSYSTSKVANNPLHGRHAHGVADSVEFDKQATNANANVGGGSDGGAAADADADNVEMVNATTKSVIEEAANEAALMETVPLKTTTLEEAADDEDGGDDDDDDDEKQPLMGGAGKVAFKNMTIPMAVSSGDGAEHVQQQLAHITDIHGYQHKVEFIDDTLLLIKEKKISPLLFKLTLAHILSKVVTAVLLGIVATVLRVYIDSGP
mmetsp:Transcript_18393/g.29154  ORF Transcript_18393/g.29154 Transcript_18393/m.29154 type:complete len:914 (-) Transcript_18393:4361-7102(-)